MKSPFKAMLGKRILIPFPTEDEVKKSSIILGDKIQADMSEELIKKYMRIPVIQVGAEVERVTVGDEIYIPARMLAPGRSDAVEIDGVKYFIINENDIAAVY